MKSDDDLNEFLGVLSGTQFYYSEVCLSFAQLESKKWNISKKPIVIPSIANEDEIKEIEQKADNIDFDLPTDDEEEDNKDESNREMNTIKDRNLKRVNGKRRPIPWTDEEVEAIKDGILKHGIGKWADIYKMNRKLWDQNGRTRADIRYKYRTLKKHRDFQDFLKKNKIKI